MFIVRDILLFVFCLIIVSCIKGSVTTLCYLGNSCFDLIFIDFFLYRQVNTNYEFCVVSKKRTSLTILWLHCGGVVH